MVPKGKNTILSQKWATITCIYSSHNNKEDDDDLAEDENTTKQLKFSKKKWPHIDDIQDNDEVNFENPPTKKKVI